MIDILGELIGVVFVLVVLSVCYAACPPTSCAGAVRECALSDGALCDDVDKYCPTPSSSPRGEKR